MELLKAPQEVLDRLFKDEGKDEDQESPSVGVWKDCWDSVQVFRYSQPELIAGMGSVVWGNIRGSEILSVASLLRIKPNRWPQVLEDVHYMAAVASNIRNES